MSLLSLLPWEREHPHLLGSPLENSLSHIWLWTYFFYLLTFLTTWLHTDWGMCQHFSSVSCPARRFMCSHNPIFLKIISLIILLPLLCFSHVPQIRRGPSNSALKSPVYLSNLSKACSPQGHPPQCLLFFPYLIDSSIERLSQITP